MFKVTCASMASIVLVDVQGSCQVGRQDLRGTFCASVLSFSLNARVPNTLPSLLLLKLQFNDESLQWWVTPIAPPALTWRPSLSGKAVMAPNLDPFGRDRAAYQEHSRQRRIAEREARRCDAHSFLLLSRVTGFNVSRGRQLQPFLCLSQCVYSRSQSPKATSSGAKRQESRAQRRPVLR